MNINNYYANVEQIFNHIDNDGLLVGNNAEWAKEAVCKADYIDLDYFIPVIEIDNMIKYCKDKIEFYRDLGSISKMECYNDFINMLKSLYIDEDDLIEDLMMEQKEQM
jgi:hypothetical protein